MKKSPLRTNAQIKADNAAFEKLSPARKRVAIARDAAIEFGRLFQTEPDDPYHKVKTDAVSLLRAIMENIVVNKGTFRPEIQPVRKWVTAGFRG